MQKWIALLRGVNVGGNKKLPMAEFRDMLAGLGFGAVATYIQSGNAVFDAAGTAGTIGGQIENGLQQRFGFHADTFVMPAARVAAALAENPFPQAEADPKALHLIFLAELDQELDEPAMRALLLPDQDFRLGQGVVYLYAPQGISQCPLADKLPRFIKGSMTARNLRSTQMILALAEA